MLEPNVTKPVSPPDHPWRVFALAAQVWKTGVVLLLGAIFAASVISFSRNASPTYDEVAHLPAGYSYLRWDDYRLNPQHPPLAKMLAALPLMWRTNWPAGVDLENGEVPTGPDTDGESSLRHAWIMSFEDSNAYYNFGHSFLYGTRPGSIPPLATNAPPLIVPPSPESFYNPADTLVFLGRLPILALGLVLALLVFLWAREWFGFTGGILALALFCFDPNFIAHSGQVTTDVGVSLFLFGAIYFLWRLCRRVELSSLILFLLFFSLAFITKFTAILLLPIFWLIVPGRIFFAEPLVMGRAGRLTLTSRASRLAWFAGLFGAALLATYVAIWASYSFRYSAAKNPETAAKAELQILKASGAAKSRIPHRQPGYFPIETAVRASAATRKLLATAPLGQVGNEDVFKIMDEVPLGPGGKLILFAQKHRLLPEAYIFGFAHAEMKSQSRGTFLLGNYSNTGFHSYFFNAFLLKTPLPALLLVVTALVLSLLRCARKHWVPIFLLVPVGLYFLVAVTFASQPWHPAFAADLSVPLCSGRGSGSGNGTLAAVNPSGRLADRGECDCGEQSDGFFPGQWFEMAKGGPALSGLFQRTRRRSGQRFQGTGGFESRLGARSQKPETLAGGA